MPIEHINKTDTLNEGREKLNNAITAFNETVVEGDSSVEAAQARVDEDGVAHSTLKARIDDGFEKTSQQLAQIEQDKSDITYVDDGLDKRIELISTKNTVTVGEGGDYPTINSALYDLSYKRPQYTQQANTGEYQIFNELFEIILLSGFIMREQIMLEGGVDLGYIVISSEDDIVPVNRDFITKVSSQDKKPIFSGHFNCTLPIINTLFSVETVIANDISLTGIHLVGNSSVIVTSGAGVKNAGRGMHINGGSSAYARNAIFDDCNRGIRLSQGSQISARGVKARNCTADGIAIALGCTADIRDADVSHAVRDGLHVEGESFVVFDNGVSTNCGRYGLYSAGTTSASGATITGNQRGAYCRESSLNISNGHVANNIELDVYLWDMAFVKAFNTVTTNSTDGMPKAVDINGITSLNELNPARGIVYCNM